MTVEKGGGVFDLSGQVVISGVTVDHPRLASEPLEGLDFNTDFKLGYNRDKEVVHLERFLVSRGLARMTIRGDVWLTRLATDLFIHIPPTS